MLQWNALLSPDWVVVWHCTPLPPWRALPPRAPGRPWSPPSGWATAPASPTAAGPWWDQGLAVTCELVECQAATDLVTSSTSYRRTSHFTMLSNQTHAVLSALLTRTMSLEQTMRSGLVIWAVSLVDWSRNHADQDKSPKLHCHFLGKGNYFFSSNENTAIS